jgi:hypothetical protein
MILNVVTLVKESNHIFGEGGGEIKSLYTFITVCFFLLLVFLKFCATFVLNFRFSYYNFWKSVPLLFLIFHFLPVLLKICANYVSNFPLLLVFLKLSAILFLIFLFLLVFLKLRAILFLIFLIYPYV